MMNRLSILGLAAVLVTAATIAFGPSARAASDILVVRHGDGANASDVGFTEAELRSLPQVTVRTATEFTDGVVAFVGPLARDVLAAAGLDPATTAHLVAANDYAVDVPVSDFQKYDVILAMEANGKELTRRDKGPLWVIYPINDHAELKDPTYTIRLVWQLTTVELH